MIATHLQYNGYDEIEAILIAKLCTFKQVLPQGAPTCPMHSNTFLYDFDCFMDDYAKKHGITYSRYADDLTFSGDDKAKVKDALIESISRLRDHHSLRINGEKTRIVSFNSREFVTGLVVNEKVQPPRYKRRQIRAAFYKASIKEHITIDEINKLRGYFGYLSAIPVLKDTPILHKYRKILSALPNKLKE
jgi:RNA-directed DNA polymerase